MKNEIALIYACDNLGVIGKDGKIPWYLPEDLIHFKYLTKNCPVIMGSKTWNSLPEQFKPLPQRENIVLSNSISLNKQEKEEGFSLADSVKVFNSVTKALNYCNKNYDDKTIWIIGGSSVYNQTIDLADRIEETKILSVYEGDCYAPVINPSVWSLVGSTMLESKTGLFYRFNTYRKSRF